MVYWLLKDGSRPKVEVAELRKQTFNVEVIGAALSRSVQRLKGAGATAGSATDVPKR